MTVSTEANKEIVRRFFEEAWNQNKVAELEDISLPIMSLIPGP